MPQQNVAKMSKDADELHRNFYPEQYGEPPLDPDPEDLLTEPEKVSETASVEPESSEAAKDLPAPEEGKREETQPTPEAATSVEITPKEPAPEPWESRYRTLQGKYDAEVPRLFAEISALRKQLEQPAPQTQAPVIPPTPAGPLDIKAILAGDKDLEKQLATFSEDYPDVSGLLVKLTERAASVNVQRMNEAINAQAQTAQTVQELKAETRNQQYWDIVNRELPDWQETRNDPDFAVWLGELDPYTGVTRGDLTQDAIVKNDAHRVVNIYKGFRAAKATNHQPSTSTSNQPAVNPAAALVAPPSGSRSAPTLTTQNKETPITSAYIKQFYNDAAKGKYRANEKEFNIIETRINRAVAEGKVS